MDDEDNNEDNDEDNDKDDDEDEDEEGDEGGRDIKVMEFVAKPCTEVTGFYGAQYFMATGLGALGIMTTLASIR